MNVTTVKRLIPAPVKKLRRTVRAHMLERAAQPRLLNLQARMRAEWGDDFLLEVAPNDEMALFGYGDRMSAQAQIKYFTTGPRNMAELQRIFKDQGIDLATVGQILDFAGGYGRLTRYFVQLAGSQHVTHSDISAEAVYWVGHRLRVRGFVSTPLPEDVHHDGRYDLILAVSLFSHLPLATWERWLVKLASFLAPGGRLLFSTANEATAEFTSDMLPRLQRQAEGFAFIAQNETLGRLPEQQYGSAYVTEAWVRATIEHANIGQIVGYYPASLWGAQDAYVLHRPS